MKQDAVSKFVPDFSEYIPLGSCTVSLADQFHFQSPQPVAGRIGSGTPRSGYQGRYAEWTEVTQLWSGTYPFQGWSSLAQLCRAFWIRAFLRSSEKAPSLARCRIYVLPDDVWRSKIDRNDVSMKRTFRDLIGRLDLSPESWDADASEPLTSWVQTQRKITEEESLFYLFNTLESPKPSISEVACAISRDSMNAILHASDLMPEVQTPLYPYQMRSAAEMIRREVHVRRTLDPRLDAMVGPEGHKYFYDRQTGTLLLGERLYEETRGGILAETMGLGKTLICLTAILATKGHWPAIPPEYSLGLHPVRPRVGSLREMAAAAIGKANVPWRVLLQDHEPCLKILEENIGSYVIRHEPKRSLRAPQDTKEDILHLSTATLIIVPPNLFAQWKSEIQIHLTPGSLQVLYVEGEKIPFPPLSDVLRCDIIIMSKKRFELEMDVHAGSETPDEQEKAISPLRLVHFLRLIVDEGHDFASSTSKNSSFWALQKLRVERKWIVSGTPGQGLVGAELDQATMTSHESQADVAEVLKKRRTRLPGGGEKKDLEHLGRIVSGFFAIQPWANSAGNDLAPWSWYVLPDDDPGSLRKPFSLRKVLQGLVIRHRTEDFKHDIDLPALHNEVVYVEPSWNDKLSINLFILGLTANAVTSERVDQDYMFHPHNRGPLITLINNLRQSGFYWTSFTREDIRKTIDTARKWLDKEEHHADKYADDRRLLGRSVELAEAAVNSSTWTALSNYHEMGMYIHNFPKEARGAWSLVPGSDSNPTLIGALQLADAQKHVDSQISKHHSDPTDGLPGCGLRAMQRLHSTTTALVGAQASGNEASPTTTLLMPSKSEGAKNLEKFEGTQLGGSAFSVTNRKARLLDRQTKFQERKTVTPRKRRVSNSKSKGSSTSNSSPIPSVSYHGMYSSATCAGLSFLSQAPQPYHNRLETGKPQQPQTSENIQTSHVSSPTFNIPPTILTGTASAKLSYLLSRLIALHPHEKSLIFYDFDNIAFYTAQALDILSIPYLIYTGSLSSKLKNTYIHTFNTSPYFRVMLMDLKQAAHGLHVASASRVFFVNPVWQPNIEAQAIKRAHRIGQKREVWVETLVMKGTLEEELWKRRRGMSEGERRHAEKSMLDDPIMWDAIKGMEFLEIGDGEKEDVERQIARLEVPQRVFGRIVGGIEQQQGELRVPESPVAREPRKRARKEGASAVTSTPASLSSQVVTSPPPPLVSAKTVPPPTFPFIQTEPAENHEPAGNDTTSIFGPPSGRAIIAEVLQPSQRPNPDTIDLQHPISTKPKKKVGFA